MDASLSLAQKLLASLEPLQTQIKDWHCRVVPSAFNSQDDALRAFPIARDWRWYSLEEHLLRMKPETLILQLPSFWQNEPFVHNAGRAAEVPLCIIEPQNYPLDKAAIKFAAANGVLAEAAEAAGIAEYLLTHDMALPPYWILVYAADAYSFAIPQALQNPHVTVAAEVHLVPGVPLLVQCEYLAKNKKAEFHYTDTFAWSDASTVTSSALLCPIESIALPFAVTQKGTCACGKLIVERV